MILSISTLQFGCHAYAIIAIAVLQFADWKERYPLMPIEHYAPWRHPDGFHFDPWMRVHERIGATVLKPEPRSMRITGTVAEWEDWTQMAFPETGAYWLPGGLAAVTIDRDAAAGRYWEPNAWIQHEV